MKYSGVTIKKPSLTERLHRSTYFSGFYKVKFDSFFVLFFF